MKSVSSHSAQPGGPKQPESGCTKPQLAESRTRLAMLVERLRDLLRFLRFGSCILAGLPAPAAWAGEVFIFGDSGADMGNMFALPGRGPKPNAPYYRGSDGLFRLADGPMWPELLYPGMQSHIDPSHGRTLVNFSYGGATTHHFATFYEPEEVLPIGVASQLDTLEAELAAGRLSVGPGARAFLYAGSNDFFEALTVGDDLPTTVTAVGANLSKAVERLAGQGIETVFVSEIADFGEAAAFYHTGSPPEDEAAFREALNALAAQARTEVRSAMARTRDELGGQVRIVILPFNSLFTAIRANPRAFGFTNITDPIYDSETDEMLVTDPAAQKGHLFLDSVETTRRSHALEATYYLGVIDAIDGGPQQRLSRVFDGARTASDALSRTLRERARRQPLGGDGAKARPRWEPFLASASELTQLDPADLWERADIDTGTFLVGLARTGDGTPDFAAALGYFNQEGHVGTPPRIGSEFWRAGRDALHFRLSGLDLQLRGERHVGPLTLRADAAVTWLDLETRRDPGVPTMLARGKSDGWMARGRFSAGAPFSLGPLRGAWDAGLAYDDVSLGGFSENGAPGLDLRYGDIEDASFRALAGVHLFAGEFLLGRLRILPQVRLELEYELGGRATEVEAELIDNIAPAITGFASRGRRLHGTLEPRIVLPIADRASVVVSARLEGDTDGYERVGGWVSASISF